MSNKEPRLELELPRGFRLRTESRGERVLLIVEDPKAVRNGAVRLMRSLSVEAATKEATLNAAIAALVREAHLRAQKRALAEAQRRERTGRVWHANQLAQGIQRRLKQRFSAVPQALAQPPTAPSPAPRTRTTPGAEKGSGKR